MIVQDNPDVSNVVNSIHIIEKELAKLSISMEKLTSYALETNETKKLAIVAKDTMEYLHGIEGELEGFFHQAE